MYVVVVEANVLNRVGVGGGLPGKIFVELPEALLHVRRLLSVHVLEQSDLVFVGFRVDYSCRGGGSGLLDRDFTVTVEQMGGVSAVKEEDSDDQKDQSKWNQSGSTGREGGLRETKVEGLTLQHIPQRYK